MIVCKPFSFSRRPTNRKYGAAGGRLLGWSGPRELTGGIGTKLGRCTIRALSPNC